MDKVTESHIDRGVATLTAGLPLIFPTDTVYGLGVAVGIAESPEILYDIKERDHGKPVAWLVAKPESLNLYGKGVPDCAFDIARWFWPGPLTIVVKAASNVKKPFCAEDGTIALRMPDNEVALALIERTGMPLATTSANISGQKPPKTFDEVDTRLLERVPLALRDDKEKTGVASTVIDCTTEYPRMLREGDISFEEIQRRMNG